MFTKEITIYFRDADDAGLLFFGNLFGISHNVMEDFVRHLGFDWRDWYKNPNWGVPFRHAEADYFRPFYTGETYLATVRIAEVSTSSIKLVFDYSRDGTQHAQVILVPVFVNLKTVQKIPIPEIFLDKLKSYADLSKLP